MYTDSVFAGHEKYKWSSLLDMEPKNSHALYASEILPFLCLHHLGRRIDKLPFLTPSVVSDYIYYQLLTSIDQMFYEALEEEPVNKETIIMVLGENYDYMIISC